MRSWRFTLIAAWFLILLTGIVTPVRAENGGNVSTASIQVFVDQPSSFTIPKYITGKFCEHLHWNIYNGMDAQILRNPTFADFSFATGGQSPDGYLKIQMDEAEIGNALRRDARRFGFPESELDRLVQARSAGMAAFWTRAGDGSPAYW